MRSLTYLEKDMVEAAVPLEMPNDRVYSYWRYAMIREW